MDTPRALPNHEVIKQLEQHAPRGRRAGVLVRMAAHRNTGTSDLIASSWQFGDQPPEHKEQHITYPRLVLIQRWLRRADGLRALADVLDRGQATVPGIGAICCPQLSLTV